MKQRLLRILFLILHSGPKEIGDKYYINDFKTQLLKILAENDARDKNI